MAHADTYFEDKEQRWAKEVRVEVRAIIPDTQWERDHMAWLSFDAPLDIACGCEDCTDAIYDILTACIVKHEGKGARIP